MQKNKAVIIGIDVGGTKILLQTFDKKMKVLDELKLLTEVKKGEKGFTNQLINLIEPYFSPDIQAIGIAVPGIVHMKKGLLVKAPHLPTGKNYPLKKILKTRFKVPVHVDNDINAFLWAEKNRTNLKKHKNIVAIMIGTGLGGAILSEGKLIYGGKGYAGETGHMIIRQNHPLMTLEQNTGGFYIPKIVAMLKAKGKNARDPRVKKYILEQM